MTEESCNFSGIFTPTLNIANNANANINGGAASSVSVASSCGSSSSTYVNICANCGNYPCTCGNYTINLPNTGTIIPNTWVYPNITPGTTWSTSTWPIEEPAVKLFEMLLQGKDLVTHKDKYLELIGKLSWVNGDNLQTVAVYERLRRLAKLLGIMPRKEKKDD